MARMSALAHILAASTGAVLVLSAVPVTAQTAPPAPPRDSEPPVTGRSIVGEGEREAGLVIDDGEQVRTFCVRFDEDELDGEELMLRTDLELEVARFGALGAAVCAIDGVGCPAADCHCTAAYWSYWQGSDAVAWSSSPVGASSRTVRDGDRDARVWGDGRRGPPALSTEEICDRTRATDGDLGAGAAPERDDTAGPTLAEPATLASFLALLAALLAAGWWVRRRRVG
jgi:hypothetical protein